MLGLKLIHVSEMGRRTQWIKMVIKMKPHDRLLPITGVPVVFPLTPFSLVPHIWSINQVSIGSDNGLSPIRRQIIIWTNAGLLSIGPLGTNFTEILTKVQNFSFTKMHLKISSVKWRPFCPGGDELMCQTHVPEGLFMAWISNYIPHYLC